MKKYSATSLFAILGIICSSFLNSCLLDKGHTRIDDEFLGYRMHVDYGDREEVYFYESFQERIDLNDLFAEFSLRNDPSMRFITTNQSIEIYDIMGTRNNLEKEWKIYLNNKHLPGTVLKKGVVIHQNSKLSLRFQKATRMILQ